MNDMIPCAADINIGCCHGSGSVEGVAVSVIGGFSDGSIKSVRGKPLAQNPNRDADKGIDETQNRLVPSRLRAHRCSYQDNCGRNPRRDNVLLSTQKYHYDRADADHDRHAQTRERENQEISEAQSEADARRDQARQSCGQGALAGFPEHEYGGNDRPHPTQENIGSVDKLDEDLRDDCVRDAAGHGHEDRVSDVPWCKLFH
jgi:hypothetical protein